jgi:hypothetical protein
MSRAELAADRIFNTGLYYEVQVINNETGQPWYSRQKQRQPVKVLITTDFFGEFELYETYSPEILTEYARAIANGDTETRTDAKLIGNQDTLTVEEAKQAADQIIFLTDFVEG